MSNSDYLFNPPPFQVQPLDSQISLHVHNKTNESHITQIQTAPYLYTHCDLIVHVGQNIGIK